MMCKQDNDVPCMACEYYDSDDDRCMAFECDGLDCPPLPCEMEDSGKD